MNWTWKIKLSLCVSVSQGTPGSDGPPGRDGAAGVKVGKLSFASELLENFFP